MDLFFREPLAHRRLHHGLWFSRGSGSSYKVLSPLGFAPKDEAWARHLPAWPLSHCFPQRAGLKSAWQASATQSNSQRTKKSSVRHMDQDTACYGRRDRLAQARGHKLASMAVQGQMAQGRCMSGTGGGWGSRMAARGGWNLPWATAEACVHTGPRAPDTRFSWLPSEGGNPVPGTRGMPEEPAYKGSTHGSSARRQRVPGNRSRTGGHTCLCRARDRESRNKKPRHMAVVTEAARHRPRTEQPKARGSET